MPGSNKDHLLQARSLDPRSTWRLLQLSYEKKETGTRDLSVSFDCFVITNLVIDYIRGFDRGMNTSHTRAQLTRNDPLLSLKQSDLQGGMLQLSHTQKETWTLVMTAS